MGYWTNYITLPFDHTHDLGLGFSWSKFVVALSQGLEGRLSETESKIHDLEHDLCVTKVKSVDVTVSDQDEFKHLRAIDTYTE